MAGSRVPFHFKRGFEGVTGWRLIFKKWCYNIAYFPKVGMMRDDVLMETTDVAEAIKRLPDKLYDERQFRISRALLLSCQKSVLPEEQWTKIEDDILYLRPYIEEVQREKAEKGEWLKGNVPK